MLVSKDEFKQLKKEGGGLKFWGDDVGGSYLGGIKELNKRGIGSLVALSNGVFFNIVFGSKIFIPMECLSSATIEEKNLILEGTFKDERFKVIFELDNELKLNKAYNTILEYASIESDDVLIRPTTVYEQKAILKKEEKARVEQMDRDGVAYCPKCYSTSLTAHKKGFGIGKAIIGAAITGGIGLVAGNIGAKKVRVTCLKCGNQFWAGKK